MVVGVRVHLGIGAPHALERALARARARRREAEQPHDGGALAPAERRRIRAPRDRVGGDAALAVGGAGEGADCVFAGDPVLRLDGVAYWVGRVV